MWELTCIAKSFILKSLQLFLTKTPYLKGATGGRSPPPWWTTSPLAWSGTAGRRNATAGQCSRCTPLSRWGTKGPNRAEPGDTPAASEPGARRRAAEQHQLRLDVDEQLRTLPALLREVAGRLRYGTKAQFARDLGIPPTTLYGLLRDLRRRFERAGLNHYLE
jgi:hypothetical protein